MAQNNAFALSVKERIVEPHLTLRALVLGVCAVILLISLSLLLLKKTRKIGIICTKFLIALVALWTSLGFCVEYLSYVKSYNNQPVYGIVQVEWSEPEIPYIAFAIAFLSGGYLIFSLLKGLVHLFQKNKRNK